MDERSSALFERMRQRHFPPNRNFIQAHLTLFHKLPGDDVESMTRVLGDLACLQSPIQLEAASLRFLGRGVAFAISSPDLVTLRRNLAVRWSQWLKAQDRQPFQPHVTIQNKVAPSKARALHDQLSREFARFRIKGSGLLLWRYLGGPWEQAGAFPFTAVEIPSWRPEPDVPLSAKLGHSLHFNRLAM
jgi:2'-5' RNA ligase